MLREVTHEIEVARYRGRWFGRFSMQPLSVTDREVEQLRSEGLLEVVDWDEGHNTVVVTGDGWKPHRIRTRPRYVRASTDGWTTLTRE